MASKYPLKPGYKYSFYRTGLGSPLHQPGYEFDLTDPNCHLLKTGYNDLHDPHLKSYFYNRTRHSQLLSHGYITKDNKVKCSLKEFNQYNNYIEHRIIDLNKQYRKEQAHIKKQLDTIDRNNAKLMEIIQKKEEYKTQLLKKMEKNWRKNELRLLSEMRKERSRKLHPIAKQKMPISGMLDDSEEKTVSESSRSETRSIVLPVATPKALLAKDDPPVCDLSPAKELLSDLADLTNPIECTEFGVYVHKEKTVSELDTSKKKPVFSTTSTSKQMIKSDLPLCDLEHFKDTHKEETVSELDTSKRNTVFSTMSTSKQMIKSDLPLCDLEHFKDTHKKETGSELDNSKKKTVFLTTSTSKQMIKSDLPICDLEHFKDTHKEETVSEIDKSESNTVSLTMSTSKEKIKSDLPICDLEHFKDTYSVMLQNIFETQSDHLSPVSGELVEKTFDKITSAGPGCNIGFTPVKAVAKKTLHDIRGKAPCRYLISRLEVMSTANEIVENAISKWHEIAVQKFSIQYEDVFEERTSFKKLYKFFICANNQEEMYKATLPIAMESILESSEEIVKNVLAHLEKFAKSRSQTPFKYQSDSFVVASLKHSSSKSHDNKLKTRSLSDVFRPHEESHIFLNKELENLAANIEQPEHKVQVSIQKLITIILETVGADIKYNKRQETGGKISISTEEKFLLYKYLVTSYTPSKKELLRQYSRILHITESHKPRMSTDPFTVAHSEDQFLRAVIEEVNVPGMVTCFKDEAKHDNIKADWIKVGHDKQCREYFENESLVSPPLDDQNKLNENCFLLNMFNYDHLIHSQNEFNRPLKVIENLVSETLIKILKDLKYPIPEHLYGFVGFPNKYNVDTTIECQKESNTLLLPSDIESFSHHLVEYILKLLYASSSYDKWKECFQSMVSQVAAIRNTYVFCDCNPVAPPSPVLSHSQENIIWEEIAHVVSAKIESFLLLKFRTYLTVGEIVEPDLMQCVPRIHKELGVVTKAVVTKILDKIAESISQQQTLVQFNTLYELFSKDDTSVTRVLISSLLAHISSDEFDEISEEWQPKSPASHECLDGGCALHNVYNGTLSIYSQKSSFIDFASSTLGTAFTQIMETIKVKYLKSTFDQSTLLAFEADISKCCPGGVSFLQTEINVLSKCIVEDLINKLCSANQKMKEYTSLLKYEGSVVTGICQHFSKTVSNSVFKDIFGKCKRFISLALKATHPSSKNISDETYFPRLFDQQNLLYGPAEDPKTKLKRTLPKSSLYKHSKHLSREILHVMRNQLEKISNNIRHSLLEDEDVASEPSNPLVSEVEHISLHSSSSQDESITFGQDTHIMQNIETNIRKDILQTICAHLKEKESVTQQIVHEVKKVMLTLFKQLLIDLSVPIKRTHFIQLSKFHQQLLSENLLKCSQHGDSYFLTSEVNDIAGEILKLLFDIIQVSNETELQDRTDSFNRDVQDRTYGVRLISPVTTILKNFVISKIISLYCQSMQKPSHTGTTEYISAYARLESFARELADGIIQQAEEHLHKQIKDIFPNDNFLPVSYTAIADHIVNVFLLSLKYTYQFKEAPTKLPTSGKEECQKTSIKCNAKEIAKMLEIIIRDTIDNLTSVNLSNITLDICAMNLASSVLALLQRELEQERSFIYEGMKYIIDKNALATETVTIILQKFSIKGDISLTNTTYNVDNICTHSSKHKMSRMSHSASHSEPELSALIQQVECVLHDAQTNLLQKLKMARSQLSCHACETSLGFTRADVEFVAKDIVEIILVKLSKHLQDILYYPNLSSREQSFLSSGPEHTPCNQSCGTNSMGEFFVEDCLLSYQLVSAVSDKTAGFAAALALKCKSHLPVKMKYEKIGTFLSRFNTTSSGVESYSTAIVMKVLENIKPRFKSKLLHIDNMTREEDIQVTCHIDRILSELSFKYYSSFDVSEEVSPYSIHRESDIENGEVVDSPEASTERPTTPSLVNEQKRFTIENVVSLTNRNTESDIENGEAINHSKALSPIPPSSINEQKRFCLTRVVSRSSSSVESDFENGEAMNYPRASTPKLSSSSSSSSSFSVNEQLGFIVPEVLSPTNSNIASDTKNEEIKLLLPNITRRPSSSSSVNENRSNDIRLNFL